MLQNTININKINFISSSVSDFFEKNITTEEGQKYLQYYNKTNLFLDAVQYNKINIVKYLVKQVNIWHKTDFLSLLAKTYSGINDDCINILLNDSNINLYFSVSSALITAIDSNYKSSIKFIYLIITNNNIKQIHINCISDSLFIYALDKNNTEVFNYLLNCPKFNFNVKNIIKYTLKIGEFDKTKILNEYVIKKKNIEKQNYEKKIKKIKNYLLYLLKCNRYYMNEYDNINNN